MRPVAPPMTPSSTSNRPFRAPWLAAIVLLGAGWLPLRASGPPPARPPAEGTRAQQVAASSSAKLQNEALLFGGCVLLALGTLLRRRHASDPNPSPAPQAVNVTSI